MDVRMLLSQKIQKLPALSAKSMNRHCPRPTMQAVGGEASGPIRRACTVVRFLRRQIQRASAQLRAVRLFLTPFE